MKINFRIFKGMRPAVDPRNLGEQEALQAVDCDLRLMALKPFRAPDNSTVDENDNVVLGHTAAGGGGDPVVQHLVDITHFDGTEVPDGLYEVHERGTCVAPVTVLEDEHRRTYFTRPGGGMYERYWNTTAYTEDAVGVPAPDAGFQSAVVDDRESTEEAFDITWFYQVQTISDGSIVDKGTLPDVDMGLRIIFDDLGRPAFQYAYEVDNNDAGHVAPTGTYDRATYHFIIYGEMYSQGGNFIGNVYPSPSVFQPDTDAYIGGTLAEAEMGIGIDDGVVNEPLWEYIAIYYGSVSSEYSHYRSYVYTYVSDRGEEGPPCLASDVLPVFATQNAFLVLDVTNAPDDIALARLYRTETTQAGTDFYFVDDIPFVAGSATTINYSDNLLSIDLAGDTLVSTNWQPPPAGLKGLVLSPKSFYAGYVGNTVYLSEPNLGYAWPPDYAIDFVGEVRHLAIYGDTIAVFTDLEVALIVGNTPLTVRKIKLEGFELITSIFSTTELDGVLYFSTPTGIGAVSGSQVSMVSANIFSERYWRDTVDLANVRMVGFDNSLYILSDVAGTFYRLDLDPNGSQLVELTNGEGAGDYGDIRDICFSQVYNGIVVLPDSETNQYVFNQGSDVDRTVVWRSRVAVFETPVALISVRVLADEYPVTFRVYVGDDPTAKATVTLNSDHVRKMPVLRREREWSYEVEADTRIVSVEVGTSGRVR